MGDVAAKQKPNKQARHKLQGLVEPSAPSKSNFIGLGEIYGPKPNKIHKFWRATNENPIPNPPPPEGSTVLFGRGNGPTETTQTSAAQAARVGGTFGPKKCEFEGFGEICGPKPYKFTSFGEINTSNKREP